MPSQERDGLKSSFWEGYFDRAICNSLIPVQMLSDTCLDSLLMSLPPNNTVPPLLARQRDCQYFIKV